MQIIFLLVAFMISGVASADTPADQSMLRKYNYDEIEQVADYLGAKIESPSEKILNCDPTSEKANAWLSGPVKELLDRGRESELKKFRQDPKNYSSKVRNCSTRCTCNAYSLMLSDMAEDSESNQYKDFDALLTAESKKLNKEQSLTCARKLKWFCKSPFHTYLKQQ
jgi:hypothetical protein